MSVAIKLGQEVVWGTSSAGTLSGQGKILSISKKKSSKMTEQEDEDGETYSVIFFDQFSEVTVEVLAKSDSDVPDPGDALTVVGVTDMLVIDAEEKWTAGQTKKISMSLKKWTA
jgi:hypothetical protein